MNVHGSPIHVLPTIPPVSALRGTQVYLSHEKMKLRDCQFSKTTIRRALLTANYLESVNRLRMCVWSWQCCGPPYVEAHNPKAG